MPDYDCPHCGEKVEIASQNKPDHFSTQAKPPDHEIRYIRCPHCGEVSQVRVPYTK
jgi:rRNA maturation protein Nop10